MPFTYTRSLWLRDTDTAGVVYFTSVLELCHEAYEASLMETGIQLHFFSITPIKLSLLYMPVWIS
ncbi:MAG: hypothetical protein LVT47_09140 [Cyanobacteria bacterium LVE1205-1]